MSGGQRAAVVIVTLVVAIGAFLALRPEDEDSEPVPHSTTPAETTTGTAPEATRPAETTPEARAPDPVTLRVRDGQPVGGVETIEVEQGDTVRFQVASDDDHEVHLHGYDLSKDVAAGKPASFRLEATETGIFEIELEDTHTQIGELKVDR